MADIKKLIEQKTKEAAIRHSSASVSKVAEVKTKKYDVDEILYKAQQIRNQKYLSDYSSAADARKQLRSNLGMESDEYKRAAENEKRQKQGLGYNVNNGQIYSFEPLTKESLQKSISWADSEIEKLKKQGGTSNPLWDIVANIGNTGNDVRATAKGKEISDASERIKELEGKRAVYQKYLENLQVKEDVEKLDSDIFAKNKIGAIFNIDNEQKLYFLNAGEDGYDNDTYYNNSVKRDNLVKELQNMGYDDVDRYIESYAKSRNEETFTPILEYIEKGIVKHPVLGAAATTAINAVTAPIQGVGQAFDSIAEAAGIHGYSAASLPGMVSDLSKTTVHKVIDENIDNTFLNKLSKVAYNTATNIVENSFVNKTFDKLSEGVLGLNAAASTYKAGKERGLSDGQALANGIAAGIFETLFEHISLEKLRAFQASPSTTLKPFIKNVLKQSFAEGTEELFTDVANEAYDYFVNGGLSQYEQALRSGVSSKEYGQQFLAQLGETFITGALAGGGMIGVSAAPTAVMGSVAQNSADRKNGSKIRSEGEVEQLFNEAKGQGGSVGRNAVKLEKQITDGKKVSDIKIGQLDRKTTKAEREKAVDTILASADYKEVSGKEKRAIRSSVLTYLSTGGEVSYEQKQVLDTENGTKVLEAAQKWEIDKVLKIGSERAERRSTNIRKAVEEHSTEGLVKHTFSAVNAEGHKVNVGAVRSITDGEFEVVQDVETGATVKLSELKIDDRQAMELYRNLQELATGENPLTVDAVNVALSMYNTLDNTSARAYSLWVHDAYKAGSLNMKNTVLSFAEFEEMFRNKYEADITKEQLREIYEIGARNLKVNPGVTRIGRKGLSKFQAEQVFILHERAKALGLEIVLTDGQLSDENGNGVNALYIEGTNRIVMSLKSDLNLILVHAGHEIFHWAKNQNREGGAFLQDMVINVLKSDSRYDYEGIYKQIANEYKGLNEGALLEEIAAQYLGVVFANEDGIRKTVAAATAKQRSFLKKMVDYLRDFIKSLKKLIDLYGDRDKTVRAAVETPVDQLQYIADTFDEVLRKTAERKKPAESDGGVKASLSKTELSDVQSIADRKSVNEFSSSDIEKTKVLAKIFYKDIKEKSPFFRAWFGDWREYDTTPVTIANKKGSNKVPINNKDTGWDIQISGKVFAETRTHRAAATRAAVKYLAYIDSIVENAVLLDTFSIGEKKSENSLLMHSFYSVADIGNGPELLKLYVEEMNNPNTEKTSKRTYKLLNIEKASAASARVQISPSSVTSTANAIHTVSDLFKVVKSKDNSFNPNPVNPAFLNEDGTPKVYYHGTNADFTVFDRSKRTKKVSLNVMGDGNYFTTRRQGAERYGDNVIEAYLKAQKPYIFRSSEYNTVSMQIEKEFNLEEGIKGSEVQQVLKEKGYDSVVLLENDKAVVVNVFDSEQIKSATDNIGTFDKENKDIRYSRSLTSKTQEFEQYSEKQIFNWKNSKRIVIYENNSQFMQFVSRSIDDIMYDKKLYFGVISEEYAGIIEEKTGINVKGFNCSLSSNEIRKIIRTHGDYAKEQNRGQKAFTKEDFLNIPKVILGADSIRLSDKTYNGKPVIEFSKSGQERFNVAAVVSDKHMDLFVQTAFINIKKGNLAMPTGEQAPINTPEANNGTVSNNIIFENDHNVKKKYSRQLIGSTWEDIRDMMYENDVHQEVITEIENYIKNLRRRNLSRETALTEGLIPKYEAILKLAREYTKGSKVSAHELADTINDLVWAAHDGELNSRQFISTIKLIAEDIIRTGSKINEDMYREYAEFRSMTRAETVYVERRVYNQYVEEYGSVKELNRACAGKIKIKPYEDGNKTGRSLDDFYGELQEAFPGLLPEDADVYHQLYEILYAWQKIQPTTEYFSDMLGIKTDADLQHQSLVLAEDILSDVLGIKETVKTLADKYADRAAFQKEHYKEYYRKQAEEGRRRRRESEEISVLNKRILRNTNRLSDMLRNETDERHIPEDFKEAVMGFLNIFISKNDEGRDVYHIKNGVLDMVKLGNAYASYYNPVGKEGREMTHYDEDVAGWINELAVVFGDEIDIKTLSLENLKKVDNIVTHFCHIIKHENEMFVSGRKEKFSDWAISLINEMLQHTKKPEYEAEKIILDAEYGMLTPIYFFKTIGTTTENGRIFEERLFKMFRDLQDGQDKWYRNIERTKKDLAAIKEKYNYSEGWKRDTTEFTLASGEKIKLTAEEIMYMRALNIRETGHINRLCHLLEGGIIVENDGRLRSFAEKKQSASETKAARKDFEKKGRFTESDIKDALKRDITEGDLIMFFATLTEAQEQYSEALVEMLSTTGAELGNEVSRELVGIRKFTEKNYIPISVAESFLQFSVDKKSGGAVRLKNRSFTKRTTQNANATVYVRSITDIAAEHMQEMSLYNAMTIPIENLTRVFNYQKPVQEEFTEEGKLQKNTGNSYKEIFEAVYGKRGVKYFEDFLRDINGGNQVQNRDFMSRMMSMYKKSAVTGSLSVAIQQPSAIVRATALIAPKYFVTKPYSKEDYLEMLEYCPVAGIKEIGRFDTGTGLTATEWILDENGGIKEKADALLSYLPGWMDRRTWVYIWAAVKKETADRTNLKGEELLTEAAKRFRDVIDYTQVYDSTLSRSAYMRDKGTGAKMATAFLSEPTLSYNMVRDGLMNARHDKKQAARSIAAFVGATLLNAMLKTLVTALRHDDEETNYFEVYLSEMPQNFFEDLIIVNSLPVVKDIISIFKGYDVNRSDMTLFSNLYNAFKVISKEDHVPTWDEWFSLIGAVSAFTGIPLNNILKDLTAITKTVIGIGRSPEFSWDVLGQTITETFIGKEDDSVKLYRAIINGNKEIIDRYLEVDEKKVQEYKSQGYSDADALNKAMDNAENSFHSKVVSGLVSEDIRIKEAAEARLDADTETYEELLAELTGQGFDKNDVIKAVEKYISSKEDKTYTQSKSTDLAEYSYEDLFNAINAKDMTSAEYIFDKLSEKVSKDTVRGNIREEYAEEMYKSILNKNKTEKQHLIDMFERFREDWHYAATLGLRENDLRVFEAAEARYNGDTATYERLKADIVADGFDENDVFNAIEVETEKLAPAEEDKESHPEDSYLYEAADLKRYAKEYKLEATKQAIKNFRDSGKKDGKIRESLNDVFKPMYIEAWQSGNYTVIETIRVFLAALDVGYTEKIFSGWEKEANEK